MYTHTVNLGLDPREVALDQFLHLETSPLVIISQSENERTSNVKQIAGSYFENHANREYHSILLGFWFYSYAEF